MEPEQRRELERIVYGRDSSDTEREDAARQLRAADAVGVLRVEPSVEYEEPAPRRLPRSVWWWSAAAAVVVALGVASVLVLTPQPRAAEPRAAGAPVLLQIEQVGTDLLANPPDQRTSDVINLIAEPGKPLAATDLGERGGYSALGVLTDSGKVCLRLAPATGSSMIGCVTDSGFLRGGITIDHGAWQIQWLPDGTVVWDGI